MRILHLFLLLFIAVFMSSCINKSSTTPPQQSKTGAPLPIKIAMILPEKRIGRYAHSTSTAVFAYFLTREHPGALKTFSIEDEHEETMEAVLKQISDEGFAYVIAPVTLEGAEAIVKAEPELSVYIPTVNKKMLSCDAENIYFGAIDYEAQIAKLEHYVTAPLVIMYGSSKQGKRLMTLTKAHYLQTHKNSAKNSVIAYSIDPKRSNLKGYFKDNTKIQSGTFFLNTPLIKSTMIISQLSLYDVEVHNILSTQTNYNPLLLSMTQKRDLRNIYISNSITIHNDALVQANAVLNNDIVYDWINYSATVGADLFYNLMSSEKRIYDLPLIDNQIIYPVTIVQPDKTHFKIIEQKLDAFLETPATQRSL